MARGPRASTIRLFLRLFFPFFLSPEKGEDAVRKERKMPTKPLNPCRQGGCQRRAVPGENYCAEHLRAHKKEEMDSYNRLRRDRETQRFYNSALWQKIRRDQLQREPICRMCLERGKYTPAVLVDHITPIRQGGSPTDVKNLQSLCNLCHEQKSRAEGSRFGAAPERDEREDDEGRG